MTTVPLDHRGYDRFPAIAVPPGAPDVDRVSSGAGAWTTLRQRAEADSASPLIIIDAYPGVDLAALTSAAHRHLPGYRVVDVEAAAARPIEEIDALLARNLTDDRVFGVLSHHRLGELYDQDRLADIAALIRDVPAPTVVLGWGAAQLLLDHAAVATTGGPTEGSAGPTAIVVLADLPRWELQQRYRRGMPNWRCDNGGQDVLRKVQARVLRRVADRRPPQAHALRPIMDLLLDTHPDGRRRTPDHRGGLPRGSGAGRVRPFRVVPFFDPGPWGGQWMKEVFDLDRRSTQLRLVLRLRAGGEQPAARLRRRAWSRCRRSTSCSATRASCSATADLRPLRRRVPDPLRLPRHDGRRQPLAPGASAHRVHPATRFGMHYTQDESYYLLDAGRGRRRLPRLRDGVDRDAMLRDLRRGPGRAAPVRRPSST